MKVICLFGVSGSGKTGTLRLLAKTLCSQNTTKIISGNIANQRDFRVILDIKGMKIGIGTAGDNPYEVTRNLEMLLPANCDVVIIATRSKGGTHKVVQDLCRNSELVWLRQRDVWRERNRNELENQKLINLANRQSVEIIFSELEV